MLKKMKIPQALLGDFITALLGSHTSKRKVWFHFHLHGLAHSFSRRGIKQEILIILALFLLTRFFLVFVGLYQQYPNTSGWCDRVPKLLSIWCQFDSPWYLDIATNGYSYEHSLGENENQINYGFFPFYPILISLVNRLIHHPVLAGILISNIAFIIAAIYLFKLLREVYSKDIALTSIFYLFVFPVSFIFSGILTESLFLMLLIMICFYSHERKWLIVGILGFFLTLTKAVGIMLLFPILYEYLKSEKKIRKDIIFFSLWPLGIFLFFLYFYQRTGNFFQYIDTQKIGWWASFGNPLRAVFMMEKYPVIGIYIISILILFIAKVRVIPKSWALIGATLLTYPLLSGAFATYCFPRHSSVVFPLYLSLAMVRLPKTIHYLTMSFLSLLQLFFMYIWSNGYLID